jgi:iron(III) transport system permease protein
MAGQDSVAITAGQAPAVKNGTRSRTHVGGADLGLTLIYVIAFVCAATLVIIPVASLIFGSFRTGSAADAVWTADNWLSIATGGVVGTLLNTCIIAGVTAIVSTGGGIMLAWLLTRTDLKFKKTIGVFVGLTFFFPSFILAMAWVIIGAPGGFFNGFFADLLGLEFLRVNIYSAIGIIFVQTLHLTPFAYFSLRGPLVSMDTSFEEAAYMAGAPPLQTLFRVTLPFMIYPIMSSFLLIFILAIEQFAIPAIIGIPAQINVLATQLYLLASYPPPQTGLAAAVGLTLSAITCLAISLQRMVVKRYGAASITGKSYRQRQIPLGPMRYLAYALCIGYLLAAFVLPVLCLIYTSVVRFFVTDPFSAVYTTRNYAQLIDSPATLRSFLNTLIVCGFGAMLGLTLGTVIAYSTQRFRPRGHHLLHLLSSVPFGVPGIVIGLGFLWSYVYLPIYGTLWVLIFAYVARFLPYATETVGAQITQIDKSLEEGAWAAGANRLQSFLRIVLPLLRPALQSAYMLLFISYFREVAAAVLLYSASTAVISISIWSYFENANWSAASALSIVSSVIIVAVMALIPGNVFRAR